MRRFYNNIKNNIIMLLLVTLVAGVVWYSYYSATFNGLLHNDAMDYASMARNVARGEGLVSAYITPLGLQYYGVPHPNPWRAPLWPLALGAVMIFLGFNDNAVAIASGLFFILTAPLIYLIGRKIFNAPVGFFSALVFTFSPLALNFGVSGLTEPLAVFLMCLWIYSLTINPLRNSFGDFVIGLIGGLFYLARYNALLFLPFVLIYWLHKRQGNGNGEQYGGNYELSNYGLSKSGLIRTMAISLRFTVGFLIPTLPWFWRNYQLFGSPLFSLQKFEPVMFTSSYPDYSLYMMMDKPDVAAFISSRTSEIVFKVNTGWVEFYQNLLSPQFSGVSSGLMALFMLSLVVSLLIRIIRLNKGFLLAGNRPETKNYTDGLMLLLVVCFLVQLAALLVIHYIPRLFFVFTPFYILFGLAIIERIFDKLPAFSRKNLVSGIVVAGSAVVFILGNLPDWGKPHTPEPLYKKFSEQITAVANTADRTQLVLSNDGHIISWYGDRNACKIPYSPELLPLLNSYQEAEYIFLSSRASWNMPEADKKWQEIYWSKPKQLEGYRLSTVFEDGSALYVKQN